MWVGVSSAVRDSNLQWTRVHNTARSETSRREGLALSRLGCRGERKHRGAPRDQQDGDGLLPAPGQHVDYL